MVGIVTMHVHEQNYACHAHRARRNAQNYKQPNREIMSVVFNYFTLCRWKRGDKESPEL